MIKPYPDRRWPAFLRVLADTVTVAWTIVWAYLGFLIYQTVMGLEVIADGITSTGATFNSWIASFRRVALQVPLITQFLLDTADALKKYSGDPLVAAGHNIHDAILQTAIVLALLVAVPPILLVLLPYAGWRWRDMRETGAALAFVRIASMTGRAEQARAVLAYRAVSTLSFRQLMSASTDPVGDIAERRYDRLADAMIKRAGLDPTRLAPHDRPELPPHRGR
ncbi:MAG TPA: hypothetical protein VIO37_06120 [Candidatus Dormibacteraeota bacterium]|jgi:hypothetical protein